MNPPATSVATAPEAHPLAAPSGPTDPAPGPEAPGTTGIEIDSELLLLPDGRILAHHLTPELAALLQNACPTDSPVH